MSEVLDRLAARTKSLREDFDRSFERPLPGPEPARMQLLSIVVGGSKAVVRLEEVLGLHLDPDITKVPGSPPALLGLATIRGRFWPVYDLSALLGQVDSGSRRVLCLARATPPVAFAFERLDALIRVLPENVLDVSRHEMSGETLKDGDALVPLLSLPSLIERCIRQPLANADAGIRPPP